MTSTQNTNNVTSTGDVQVVINELSQDQTAGTSQINVKGWLHNNGSTTVTHSTADITCSISGSQSFTGSNFSISLGPGGALNFINHTFTVTHAADGTASVNFAVHYGVTGISNFGNNQSVSATLTLDEIFRGVWVRSGGVWKKAYVFVRSGGAWKRAVPFVRSGGNWKNAGQ